MNYKLFKINKVMIKDIYKNDNEFKILLDTGEIKTYATKGSMVTFVKRVCNLDRDEAKRLIEQHLNNEMTLRDCIRLIVELQGEVASLKRERDDQIEKMKRQKIVRQNIKLERHYKKMLDELKTSLGSNNDFFDNSSNQLPLFKTFKTAVPKKIDSDNYVNLIKLNMTVWLSSDMPNEKLYDMLLKTEIGKNCTEKPYKYSMKYMFYRHHLELYLIYS